MIAVINICLDVTGCYLYGLIVATLANQQTASMTLPAPASDRRPPAHLLSPWSPKHN